jgi:glycosyltransferase involved in cell wall biosynthesis
MRDIAPSSLPLVSVLMSVYNGERFLSQAIESILNQSFGDFEFIIIDDGSKDTTWEILTKAANQDARIRLLRNGSNLGLTKSLNMGLTLAKGAYIARQDADDIAQSMRLATQLALFEATPGLVLTGSAYWVIDGNGQILRIDHHPVDDTSIRWQMLFHNSFAHSSVMVRADVLALYGLSYNEEFRYAQDYELWSRLLDHGSAVNCKEPLTSYRLHDSNQDRNIYLEQQSIATRIAMTNVGKLGIQVSEQEMVHLRDLYLGRMTKNRLADMHNFSLLILILTRFSKSKYVNRKKLSFIRLHLFREVCRLKRSGVSGREIACLAWDVFAVDASSFIFIACSAILDKAGKILHERLRHLESGRQKCP